MKAGEILRGVTTTTNWYSQWLSTKTLPPRAIWRRFDVTGDNRELNLALTAAFIDANGDFVTGPGSLEVSIYAVRPNSRDPDETKGVMVEVASGIALAEYVSVPTPTLQQGTFVFVITNVVLGAATQWVLQAGASLG